MAASERGVPYRLFERVERERALRGWSSVQLQRESGVARSTIAKWETQPQTPQPGTVNAVADVLGIGREEALRLAGILTDAPEYPGIRLPEPECRYERGIMAEDIPDDLKAMSIRAHRRKGHAEWCHPGPAVPESAVPARLRA